MFITLIHIKNWWFFKGEEHTDTRNIKSKGSEGNDIAYLEASVAI